MPAGAIIENKKGDNEMSKLVPCPRCHGSGVVRVPDPNMPRITGAKTEIPCPNCHGTGQVRV